MSEFNQLSMSGKTLPWVYRQSCKRQVNSPDLPKISIVTPSYNQREFLESAIQSILLQEYPNLEYIIIDGGSTDNSQEIIRKYDSKLAYWVSEPDQGMYYAINKGFQHATGEIMAWLNSSDMLCPWALWVVAQIFIQHPTVEWITTLYPLRWESNGLPVRMRQVSGYNRELFYGGRCDLQQESTFWRTELWKKVGKLNEQYRFAADVALWGSFYEHAILYGVNVPLGGSRYHRNKKSYAEAYMEEYKHLMEKYQEIKSFRTWLRDLVSRLNLQYFPIIGSIVSRLVGYELHFIEGKSCIFSSADAATSSSDWRIRVRKGFSQ
jgi:glycosyltransferase involved in cell wall biosynthesis